MERWEKKKGSERSPMERMMVHMMPKDGTASLDRGEEEEAEARGLEEEVVVRVGIEAIAETGAAGADLGICGWCR